MNRRVMETKIQPQITTHMSRKAPEEEKDFTSEQYANLQKIIKEVIALGFGEIVIKIQDGKPVIVEKLEKIKL
jgi:hypothetical protein